MNSTNLFIVLFKNIGYPKPSKVQKILRWRYFNIFDYLCILWFFPSLPYINERGVTQRNTLGFWTSLSINNDKLPLFLNIFSIFPNFNNLLNIYFLLFWEKFPKFHEMFEVIDFILNVDQIEIKNPRLQRYVKRIYYTLAVLNRLGKAVLLKWTDNK